MHAAIAVPVTLALVVRAYTRKSLTLPGILTAALTATIHALHPSPVPFTLLVIFFLLGTTATKIKHDIKATLTLSSTGSAGGEGARTTTQVLANSGVASTLILLHLYRYGLNSSATTGCFGGHEDNVHDIFLVGIIANYAAVTADTLSSELGILSKSKPRLITAPWRVVPPGTNGGVTMAGLISGMLGSFVMGVVSMSLLSFCNTKSVLNITMVGHKPPQEWHAKAKLSLVLAITTWGTLGSMLDSLLGALLQASVVDRRTGKVVEGAGGTKVLITFRGGRKSSEMGHAKKNSDDVSPVQVHEESRTIGSGQDILDNNQVNLLMALLMSLGGISIGIYFWHVDAVMSLF